MQICPSILEPTVNSLLSQINKLSPYIKYFQIDIADGIFVPNKTVSLGNLVSVLKKQSNNQTMKQCVFDFHLMVVDFKTDIKKINQLKKFINIKNIFIHYSAIKNPRSFARLRLAQDDGGGIPIGLTLNPQDQVKDLAHYYSLNSIPCIQIMSVTPGVQGNPFLPETLKKIEQLRVLGYRNKIFLDGAVNDKTIPYINTLKFKPDVICPGSYLTKTNELRQRVQFLISNS